MSTTTTLRDLIGCETVPFNDAAAMLLKALDKEGERLVYILAADSGPDLQQGRDPQTGRPYVAERLSPKFIQKMKELAAQGRIELVDGHDGALPIGYSVGVASPEELKELGVETQYEAFVPVFKLLPGPLADHFWDLIQNNQLHRTFSVGGRIASARVIYDPEVNGYVKEIEDGYVDHVAICRPGAEANPRTGLVTAMVKALQEAGLDWDELRMQEEVLRKMPDEYPAPEYGYPNYGEPGELIGPEVTDFAEAVAMLEEQGKRPRLTRLLIQVLQNILNDSEGDKVARMKQAIDDYAEAMGGLEKKLRRKATEETTGGAAMFKTLSKEARAKVASLFGMSEEALNSLTPAALAEKIEALSKEQREAFFKVFLPSETMPAEDIADIEQQLLALDAEVLAKKLDAVVAKLSKVADALETLTAEKAEAKEEAPVAEDTTQTTETVTMADIKRLLEELLATKQQAAVEVKAEEAEASASEEETGELGKALGQAVAELRAELNKTLDRKSATAESAPASPKERIIAMLQEGMSPEQVLDKVFRP